MKTRHRVGLAALALVVASVFLAPPASRAFTLNEVYAVVPALACDGLSQVQGFERQIIVLSLSGGISRNKGGAVPVPVEMVKGFDGCTPLLYKAAVLNTLLPSVVIRFINRTGEGTSEFFKIELTNAHVLAIGHSGAALDQAVERVTFAYERIKLTETPLLGGSPVVVECDFAARLGCR